MGHHYGGMHMFWWIFWVAMMIALSIWLMPRRGDSPLDTLRRSYASGAITEEEYRRRVEVLANPARSKGETSKQGVAGDE